MTGKPGAIPSCTSNHAASARVVCACGTASTTYGNSRGAVRRRVSVPRPEGLVLFGVD